VLSNEAIPSVSRVGNSEAIRPGGACIKYEPRRAGEW
jgi:hypothetical protein